MTLLDRRVTLYRDRWDIVGLPELVRTVIEGDILLRRTRDRYFNRSLHAVDKDV
jgi:hypothetical protein